MSWNITIFLGGKKALIYLTPTFKGKKQKKTILSILPGNSPWELTLCDSEKLSSPEFKVSIWMHTSIWLSTKHNSAAVKGRFKAHGSVHNSKGAQSKESETFQQSCLLGLCLSQSLCSQLCASHEIISAKWRAWYDIMESLPFTCKLYHTIVTDLCMYALFMYGEPTEPALDILIALQ